MTEAAMSEHTWLTCTDYEELLLFLSSYPPSPRKARWFACACCRRVLDHLADPRSRRAINVAEQWADNLVGNTELEVAFLEADKAYRVIHGPGREKDAALAAVKVATYPAEWDTPDPVTWVAAWDGEDAREEAKKEVANLLRDIFGNPFRPVTVDPGWQTGDVVSLAQAIYDERAFDRMPILADALEDAGCTNADVLNHCRQPGEHVRGCWVVDLVLAKQ